MSTPTLLVVVCGVADVPKVQATLLKDGWGEPVLSANGLAKWGVWDCLLTPTTRTQLAAIASVKLTTSDAAANVAVGWMATLVPPIGSSSL